MTGMCHTYIYISNVLSVIYAYACGWIWRSWCLVIFQKTATCGGQEQLCVRRGQVVGKTFFHNVFYSTNDSTQIPNIPLNDTHGSVFSMYGSWKLMKIHIILIWSTVTVMFPRTIRRTVLMYAETKVSKVKLSKRTWQLSTSWSNFAARSRQTFLKTTPQTNISPENWWLLRWFVSFKMVPFHGTNSLIFRGLGPLKYLPRRFSESMNV